MSNSAWSLTKIANKLSAMKSASRSRTTSSLRASAASWASDWIKRLWRRIWKRTCIIAVWGRKSDSKRSIVQRSSLALNYAHMNKTSIRCTIRSRDLACAKSNCYNKRRFRRQSLTWHRRRWWEIVCMTTKRRRMQGSSTNAHSRTCRGRLSRESTRTMMPLPTTL